jgi:hypothetical protein
MPMSTRIWTKLLYIPILEHIKIKIWIRLEIYICQIITFFYICHLEDIFKNNFEEIVLKKNSLDDFISHYSKILLKHPCEHFPHTYLLKLYSRMRLFYCLKFVNRNFKVTNEKGEKICRKMIIWSHS